MLLRLRELKLSLDSTESQLPDFAAETLGLEFSELRDFKVVRKGIDARRKSEICRVYTVEFSLEDNIVAERLIEQFPHLSKVDKPQPFVPTKLKQPKKVVVVGMGPAGLFAALTLSRSGADVLLIERGKAVAERMDDVRAFWQGGPLNPQSNIQFGEGGAGTFSDGKLTTRIKHPLVSDVLQSLVDFGAPAEIQWLAKPHIGSDRLRKVLVNMRKRLIDAGVEVRFESQLTGIEESSGNLRAAVINGDQVVPCDSMVLCIGHSARDTYEMLFSRGVELESKDFAVGLRVEHPLALINRIQYAVEHHPQLGAAEYNLSWQDKENGRGVYSFCMCPGGVIVNASSEAGGVVVNGMSDYRRDAAWSNSALVVTVGRRDFDDLSPLAGMYFQRYWEERAYEVADRTGAAPAQTLLGFLHGKSGDVSCSCQPQVVSAELDQVLPAEVSASLRRAIPVFERRMRGFAGPEAALVGVETRTSAPVRIRRSADGNSVSLAGLYPAGEGAGYAGGIMSAAIDGINAATQAVKNMNTL